MYRWEWDCEILSQGISCINKREMMEVDMHVRAMFQPSVNDARVGVRVTLKHDDAELWACDCE